MCQYKLERECNAVIQQSREEKIARMESLMDSVLPSEEFQKEERAALKLEHQVPVDLPCQCSAISSAFVFQYQSTLRPFRMTDPIPQLRCTDDPRKIQSKS